MPDPKPWYAHEYPDRPLVDGAHLCCCLLCAVSLERAGHEDARRLILFRTGWGTLTWNAQSVAWHRADVHLHDVLTFFHGPAGNWIIDVIVGPRRGRASKGWESEQPYPRPLESWPVCTHCGPLSYATFADLAAVGRRRPRRSQKQVAADAASRAARAELVARVEAVMEEQRFVAAREVRAQWRPLRAVADRDDDCGDEWW